jgi:glycosyltransferase involved in cell wall biosynthesis
MRFIILAHPLFLNSESMPRVARMLCDGLKAAGHEAVVIRPTPWAYRVFRTTRLAKWASYFDQYLIFPFRLIAWDLKVPKEALFILADQALGPWVPYIRRHKKVVHCMDMLALKSALGMIPENPTGFTGRIYQRYIRWGFRQCENFISISGRTARDLETFGGVKPAISRVVHLSLNQDYRPASPEAVESCLAALKVGASSGAYLLFVGGGQWYKNRVGLLSIYLAYAQTAEHPLPLVCVSPAPDAKLRQVIERLPARARVLFLQGVSGEQLQALYSGARLMIFPSLAEGFGWPIIEAQACGCLVLTTDDAPMNEIAGPVARLLRPLRSTSDLDVWSREGAGMVAQAVGLGHDAYTSERQNAIDWSSRFRPGTDIKRYLDVYREVMA